MAIMETSLEETKTRQERSMEMARVQQWHWGLRPKGAVTFGKQRSENGAISQALWLETVK
jgi:hypothetical protein